MIEWFVFKFFAIKFIQGFCIAVFIRILLAYFTGNDVSWKGLFLSGVFLGVLFVLGYYYILST